MIKERDCSASLSFVLLGALLGAVGYAVSTTPRGRQLLHDAGLVVDDFVSLCELVLDDDVAYEDTLNDVSDFVEKSLCKLNKICNLSVHEGVVGYSPSVCKILKVDGAIADVSETGVDDLDVKLLKRISRSVRKF
mgnify:CR=1 FL=1